jgi:hypothetical protein
MGSGAAIGKGLYDALRQSSQDAVAIINHIAGLSYLSEIILIIRTLW